MGDVAFLIAARELTVPGRGGCPRIDNVSVSIEPADRISIIGPSGSGKTTLLRHLAGLENSSGSALSRHEGLEIGFLFQDGNDVPWLSIRENFKFFAGRSVEERAILEVMNELGFEAAQAENMLAHYPQSISGGERRRVSFALVVARDPDVILLDEPMTNLDIVAREKVRRAIERFLAAHPNTAIVLVTHDLEDAIVLTNRIYIMHKGRIVKFFDVEPQWRDKDALGPQVIALEREIVALVDD